MDFSTPSSNGRTLRSERSNCGSNPCGVTIVILYFMEKNIIEINEKPRYGEKQRSSLGIPKELDNKPVLYLSSHRGAFDAKYESHVRNFFNFLDNEDSEENLEEISAFLDLSQTTPDEVVEALRLIMFRDNHKEETKLLPENTSQNDPLPDFISNITYLPKLDKDGEAVDGSHTFAIDSSNYKTLLPNLKDFLTQKGILEEQSSQGKIQDQESPKIN